MESITPSIGDTVIGTSYRQGTTYGRVIDKSNGLYLIKSSHRYDGIHAFMDGNVWSEKPDCFVFQPNELQYLYVLCTDCEEFDSVRAIFDLEGDFGDSDEEEIACEIDSGESIAIRPDRERYESMDSYELSTCLPYEVFKKVAQNYNKGRVRLKEDMSADEIRVLLNRRGYNSELPADHIVNQKELKGEIGTPTTQLIDEDEDMIDVVYVKKGYNIKLID